MIKLKNILSETNWNDKQVELGKVYSNPYATAFKPQENSVNEMQVVNKKTGKDITKHVLDLLSGKIDKKKFEKLTGLKKESVNEMSMGFDSMTGLFYLQGVPFTRERIKEVILFMKSSKVKSKVSQFEYTPALIVKDKVGKSEVTIDPKNLKTLIEFYKKNSAKLASDKDF